MLLYPLTNEYNTTIIFLLGSLEKYYEKAYDNVVIHEDNTAAIHLVKNGRSTSDRTKHILLRHFFVKQYLDDGTFELRHCDTDN